MKRQFTIALVLMILISPLIVWAQDKISVAVAANFISAFKEIAADFEAKTGVKHADFLLSFVPAHAVLTTS